MTDVPLLPPYLTPWTGFLLSRVASMGNRLFDRALQPLGLTGSHLGVLMVLRHLGPQVQAHLSAPLQVDKPTMVRLVNELEATGLAERHPHPNDRRAVLVHLTDAGTAMLDHAITVGERVTAELFSVLSTEEQHTLRALLIRIAAHVAPFEGDSSDNELMYTG